MLHERVEPRQGCCYFPGSQRKGDLGSGGLARDELQMPAAPVLYISSVREGKFTLMRDWSGCAPRRVKCWLLCLKGFYLLSKGGDFRAGLRGDRNRICISSPRCVLSGSLLIGQRGGGGWGPRLLVIPAGPSIASLVLLLFCSCS